MRWRVALGMCLMVGRAWADDAGPSWTDHVTMSASLRVRGEFADWFAPPAGNAAPGAERWAFFASRLRAGVRLLFPHLEVNLQLQDTRLTGLPHDPAPGGALGGLGTGRA